MKVCDHCKVVIENGDTCPRCGRAVSGDVPSEAAVRVQRLLAEANLHRIRGEYGLAVDRSTEVLELRPEDPEVHSLLGDIYDSQGRLDEAVKWYQMTVDLRPDSAIDRAKLERARARLSRARHGDVESVTGNWPQAFYGGSRLDAALRYVVVFCAVAVLIILFIGLIVWLRERDERAESRPVASESARSPQPQGTTSGSQRPEVPSSSPVGPESQPEALARPPAEQLLLSRVAASAGVSARKLVVEDLKSDPRHGALLITFRAAYPPTALQRAELMRDAATVAAAAFAASPNALSVTLRALVDIPGQYGPREPHLVLVCDVARPSVPIDPRRITDGQLTQILGNVWWGPEVPR